MIKLSKKEVQWIIDIFLGGQTVYLYSETDSVADIAEGLSRLLVNLFGLSSVLELDECITNLAGVMPTDVISKKLENSEGVIKAADLFIVTKPMELEEEQLAIIYIACGEKSLGVFKDSPYFHPLNEEEQSDYVSKFESLFVSCLYNADRLKAICEEIRRLAVNSPTLLTLLDNHFKKSIVEYLSCIDQLEETALLFDREELLDKIVFEQKKLLHKVSADVTSYVCKRPVEVVKEVYDRLKEVNTLYDV